MGHWLEEDFKGDFKGDLKVGGLVKSLTQKKKDLFMYNGNESAN